MNEIYEISEIYKKLKLIKLNKVINPYRIIYFQNFIIQIYFVIIFQTII